MTPPPLTYVHGYDAREYDRLRDQAGALVDLLHHDTAYPAASTVLEAGCGVGAQTLTLASRSPGARITSVDVSPESVAETSRRVAEAGLGNVTVEQGDLFALPYPPASFDHLFVCFVLEHLARPVEALRGLMALVAPGGTVTVIEGDHGSAYFHPRDEAADAAVACLVDLQAAAGGDSLIGRRLYPLLHEAGVTRLEVTPRVVYADGGRPAAQDAFTLRTFTAMVAGVRETALAAGMTTPERFDAGVAALERTAQPYGTFSYTFFKAVGSVPAR